jgi:DNA replication protein DnaC
MEQIQLRVEDIITPGFTCPICNGTGFVINDAKRTAGQCQCLKIKILLQQTNIPPRYAGMTFRTINRIKNQQFIEELEEIANNWTKYISDDKSFIVQGPYGTGKTTIMIAFIYALIEKGRKATIISAKDYLDIHKKLMDARRTEREEIENKIKDMKDVQYLVIQNLGMERMPPGEKGEWARETMYDLIEEFFQQKKSLSITTICSMHEIESRLGLPTITLLQKMCKIREIK